MLARHRHAITDATLPAVKARMLSRGVTGAGFVANERVHTALSLIINLDQMFQNAVPYHNTYRVTTTMLLSRRECLACADIAAGTATATCIQSP
jgi:hypothetical protein